MKLNLERQAIELHSMAVKEYLACRPFFDLLQQSARLRLMHWSAGEFIKEVIIRPGDPERCTRCAEIANRKLTIEIALAEMPIPAADCTRFVQWRQESMCICWYRSVVPGWRSSSDVGGGK